MEIDNFDLIKSHLDFIDNKLDRYIVHVLRRPKDISPEMKNALGSNESQRLIKTYYVDSLEYFDRKREAIKELCRANNARAYIIVQPKDNFECLLNLGQKILETIQNKNYSVKPEHLIRQAYCEWHKTRKKQWILDLDDKEMYGWTKEEVKSLVIKEIRAIQDIELKKHPKRDNATWLEDQMYEVPTRHGIHVISPPFNLQHAYGECTMLYEGAKKGNELQDLLDQLVLTDDKEQAKADWAAHKLHPFNCIEWLKKKFVVEDDNLVRMRKALEVKKHDIPGWLHKDGMSILFCP